MRLQLGLSLALFSIGSLVHAQPASEEPAAAPADPVACSADADCAAPATCVDSVCTAPAAPAAPAPAPAVSVAPPEVTPPAPPSAFRTFLDSLNLSLGLSAFGEFFPVSTVKVPDSTRGQFSLLGGVRFAMGTHLPNWFRLLGVIEAGYATAGLPSRGSDGVMEGAGVELSLERYKIRPFIRFMYDAVVVSVRKNERAPLAWNAYFFSVGARLSIVELHLSVGRDFAGGVAPGLGLSIGWLY